MAQVKRTFLFGTLAMNQTVFFEALGNALEKDGHGVAYLCFHERSHEYLASRGKRSFNAFREAKGEEETIDLSTYAWPSLNLMLSHEKAAFEVFDSAALLHKLRRYLAASESALKALAMAPVTVVQELGGFLSNVAIFYAARRHGFDNVFIEPSFFKGRVFFVRDSFAARQVHGPTGTAVAEEVRSYLRNAVAKKQVAIPAKDTHHYRMPMRKLRDPKNLRRLVEKSIDKYVLRKSEEFGHIGGHVARHARMYLNSRMLRRHYDTLSNEDKRFVYYPLHVPADVALTIRAPQYVDQYALIDFIARAVPGTHEVLIKEHPALVGAVNRSRILELLAARDNVRLLDPGINNYEVLRRADAVVTVNSKSGAEALLLGRPVLVLGDAFYASCELTRRIDSLGALPGALAETIDRPLNIDVDAIERYFQDVWDASSPGELYVLEAANVTVFVRSLLDHFGSQSN